MKFGAVVSLLLLQAATLPAEPKLSKAAQALIKIERDWSDADVKKDVAALDRILAEDWTGIDFEGVVMTKAAVLREVGAKSDITSTTSTVLGEMKIRIFGNTAVVSGTEVEKSQYKGEDSSGEYIWTDVFVLRKGRWQAVSSQSTKLTAKEGEEVLAQRHLPETLTRLIVH